MSRALDRNLAVIALVAVFAGCSSPDPHLYTIAPITGAPQSRSPKIIVLHTVSLARYLERSEIVRSSEDYRLAVMQNDWWGESLSAMLSRILVEELSQRMPHSTVLASSGAVIASPDATVELNVQRLDEDAAGRLVLEAQASVEFKGRGQPVVRSFRFIDVPSAPGTSGEVAAISAAVGQLADGIVPMLRSGPAGR
jgi:uncharacterized lipoprotein YmbA